MVEVLHGRNAVTKDFAKEIGADKAALDAIEGTEICKRERREDDDTERKNQSSDSF